MRLTLTRPEEQMDSGNRPSVRQRIRLGASRDGALTAMAIESHGTAGVGLGAGIGNFAQAIYDCPNFSSAQYDVFINAGPGSAMRAPGNTPGAWGLESAIDGSPKSSASTRWRCAIASIRARRGARSGALAPSGSAGRAAMRRAPTPGQ